MKLYVIGNGFDISHDIPCRYSDFYLFLYENRTDVLELMSKYYYVEGDSDLWSDFERSLEENIDYGSFADIINENAPDFSSDDFRDRNWYDAEHEVQRECDEILNAIRSGFEEWISSLNIRNKVRKYELDRTAFYLTFNYTETLELLYKISASQILHIHNKVGQELIFGHGKNSKDFDVKEALYGDTYAFLMEQEDGSFVSNELGHEHFAEDVVCEFYDYMRKNTEEVINNQSWFFKELSEIDEIIVLGHSYNKIDFPYFKMISESVMEKARWTLCYFSENDLENAKKVMELIYVEVGLQHYIHSTELEIPDPQLTLF